MGKDITVCVMTRSKSITVTTLHMLLNLTSACFSNGHRINIHFVEHMNALQKLIKTSEKILWVDYGYSLDQPSFEHVFNSTHEVLVFPTVLETVHWDKFRKRIGSGEPIHQRALEFDTTVEKKISDGFWSIEKTNPSVFLIDCKSVDKKLRTRKGEGIKIPHDIVTLFTKFKENGLKSVAYTRANVITHKHHECIGNIMECATVRASPTS